MPIRFESSKMLRVFCRFAGISLSLLCVAMTLNAQSTDVGAPWPVTTNEVTGKIAPRDIGDARLTDHFYAFVGTPGDLLITVEGRNLNGDVDVFTSSGLRPLLKFSLYAETASPVTKSVYLRKREEMIIRVEARSPNDDAGDYRLRFGGAFEAITSGPLFDAAAAQMEQPTIAPSTATTGRRVTSAGARIDEPPEVAVAPTPEPSPEATPEATPSESPAIAGTEEPKPAPTRTPRGRRGAGRRTRTPPPAKVEQPPPESEAKPADAEPAAEAEARPAPRSGRRGTGRRTVTPPVEPQPEEETGPRLVIETDDGTLIDRYMSSVRRVTVEAGRVVVIGKDGKIDRIPLASVVRMVIAP